jgi:spermidine/putrescine transport system permease protein
MAREAGVLSPRARATRSMLHGYGLLIYVFLFAPIVLLVLFSFNANQYGSFPITGWTTTWYSQVFGDFVIQDALRTTLKVAAEVTLVSVVLGTAAAFPLVRAGLRFPAGFRVAMTLPIMIPGILIGISLLILFTQVVHFWIFKTLSPTTAVIGQSLYTTPFVLLLVAARLEGFDRNLERAAGDLGANAFNRLRHVVLPLIFPAILAGALFAFTLSFDEFVITYFIIGGYNTLPIYIYTQIKYGITPEVNALAALVLITSILLISLAFVLPAAFRLARRSLRVVRRRRLEALPKAVGATEF